MQDPHQIQARPSLIARARNADLRRLHRRRTRGRLAAGAAAAVRQRPKCSPASRATSRPPTSCASSRCPRQVDRAQGDVHAAGNPHIQTDPRNIALVAKALAARLQQVDPAHAADYASAATLPAELAAGHGTLDRAGGAAARACRWCRSTRATSTCMTGSACTRSRCSSPSPASSRARRTCRKCWPR